MSRSEIQIWNPDATSILKIVHDVIGPSFRDPVNEAGHGSLTVPNTAEYRELFAQNLVVKHVRIARFAEPVPVLTPDNPVYTGRETDQFAWVIEKDTVPLTSDGTITISGRGILCWLEGGVVFPSLNVLRRRSQDVRYFGFGSSQMFAGPTGDSLGVEWLVPYERERTELGGIVEGWPTATQWQIWTSPPGQVRPPGEEAWFRRGFTTDAGQSIRIDVCADDELDMWMDDELIVSMDGTNTTNPGGKIMQTIRRGLPAGTHWITVRGRNRTEEDTAALGGSSEGQAWVAVRVAKITNDEDAGDLITMTNAATWAATTQEPGWTVGLCMLQMINEAIDRGVDRIYWTDHTYTASHDSNGVEWPHVVNRTWRVGTTDYLQLFMELTEFGADIWATPDKRLHAAAHRGVDRSETVHLRPAANLASYAVERVHKVRTYSIVSYEMGFTQVTNEEALAEHGRLETRIDAEAIDTYTQARTFALDQLQSLAQPQVDTAGNDTKVLAWTGATPYEHFWPGDTVGVPGPDGAMLPARVMAITNRGDRGGEDEFFLELDLAQTGARSVRQGPMQAIRTIARSGGAASASGQIKSATRREKR